MQTPGGQESRFQAARRGEWASLELLDRPEGKPLQMRLKPWKTFYVKFIFGTFWFGLGKAFEALFMSAWEANGTLSSGHRKVELVALNCTAHQWQGQNRRRGVLITCSVLLTLRLHPSAAKGAFHLGRHRRGREQEKSKIKISGKEIAERKMLHTTPKNLFVTWKQQWFS